MSGPVAPAGFVLPLALLVVIALLRPPQTATAATCADYPDQAAAKQGADASDADGDGVCCESLPCPCAGPG
jgi:hypothetical protein